MDSLSSSVHVVLFPFMSKGHTIPILDLARLLVRRGATVTVFTTPANRPFISQSLVEKGNTAVAASVVSLPFPDNIPGLPSGIESTDKLPSMSLFPVFALATELMQPSFEAELEKLHPATVTFMVTDGFLWWTINSASKFNIPRLASYGMGNYAMAVGRAIAVRQHSRRLIPASDDEPFTVEAFPWIKLTKNDFDSEPESVEELDFRMRTVVSTANSYGIVVNSFRELESTFLDYWNRECQPPAWCVGPLCWLDPRARSHVRSPWMEWLDRKGHGSESVLYVAFGSQAEISEAQLKEIAAGLESAAVNFLWVLKKKTKRCEFGDNGDVAIEDEAFEERVKERGIVVRDWVDQREILMHRSVGGFLSHCGWNSVMESVCAAVPLLAWPMMAEQPLNAKMVVEELGLGLRVETEGGRVKGFVRREALEKVVRELMEGERGKVVKKKAEEIARLARAAAAEGGSSWTTLGSLIQGICSTRKERHT